MADLFFGGPFRRLLYGRPFPAEWASATAAMDWIETPTSHVLRINVPGLGKDDVKVQVEDGNVLSVRSTPPAEKEREREREKEGKEAVWHVAERGRPEFAREVALPADVRVEQIRASVDNGVLTVVVPKEPSPARPGPGPSPYPASSDPDRA